MKVGLIQDHAVRFAHFVKQQNNPKYFFKWSCQKNFSDSWSLASAEFSDMYDASLQSEFSTRLWEGSKYSGKSAMIAMGKFNATFSKSMFRDLFNEATDVNQRISRFIFHCDELVLQMKAESNDVIDHHHNHQMVSLYLAFNDPKIHCYFEPVLFARAGRKIGLKNPPADFEYDRFQRLAQTVGLLLRKQQPLHEAYPLDIHDSQWLVHDFYEWLGSNESSTAL